MDVQSSQRSPATPIACALKGAIGPQIVGGPGPTFFAMLNGASRIVLFSMVASRVGKFKACPWVFDPPLSWPILFATWLKGSSPRIHPWLPANSLMTYFALVRSLSTAYYSITYQQTSKNLFDVTYLGVRGMSRTPNCGCSCTTVKLNTHSAFNVIRSIPLPHLNISCTASLWAILLLLILFATLLPI